MLKRMRASPWRQLVLFIEGVAVGLVTLAELVYQANSDCRRFRLHHLFAQAIAEAEVPDKAIFGGHNLGHIFRKPFDICLADNLNSKYTEVFCEIVFESGCKNVNIIN